MENNMKFTLPKSYFLNFEEIKTIDDIVLILKALSPVFYEIKGKLSSEAQKLLDKGLIIESSN